ncbi:MAG: DMT family transporter [Bacteroidales bacterium]|nr:DMT family transporter [Bacteroidales bacterium]
MNQKLLGHLACFATYAIFGTNIIFSRDIATSSGIPPIVLFSMRSLVAGALFWLISLFLPRERMSGKDLLLTACASLLGLFIPQLTFLTAIGITTPVDLAVINSITPIITMFIAAIFLKEPITWMKSGGVALSFAGVLGLILLSTHSTGATQTHPLGIALCIINSVSFALYLGIFRPLISRYNVVTFMRWMFLFTLLCSLPFSMGKFDVAIFPAVAPRLWWKIGFLILFATFIAYFLIPIAQKRIRPTLVSMYSYLQPIIAAVVSISIGMEVLTLPKIIAIISVFAGVLIVNRSRAAT